MFTNNYICSCVLVPEFASIHRSVHCSDVIDWSDSVKGGWNFFFTRIYNIDKLRLPLIEINIEFLC